MNPIIYVGAALVIIGLILVFLGFIKPPAGAIKSTEVKTGGVVVVGPFPIIFGSDKEAIIIAVISAIILMILALLMIRWF